MERDNNICIECGRFPPVVMLQVGHLVSVDEGHAIGVTDDELNADENLYCVCEECNVGRSSRSVKPTMYLRLMLARRSKEGV